MLEGTRCGYPCRNTSLLSPFADFTDVNQHLEIRFENAAPSRSLQRFESPPQSDLRHETCAEPPLHGVYAQKSFTMQNDDCLLKLKGLIHLDYIPHRFTVAIFWSLQRYLWHDITAQILLTNQVISGTLTLLAAGTQPLGLRMLLPG